MNEWMNWWINELIDFISVKQQSLIQLVSQIITNTTTQFYIQNIPPKKRNHIFSFTWKVTLTNWLQECILCLFKISSVYWNLICQKHFIYIVHCCLCIYYVCARHSLSACTLKEIILTLVLRWDMYVNAHEGEKWKKVLLKINKTFSRVRAYFRWACKGWLQGRI